MNGSVHIHPIKSHSKSRTLVTVLTVVALTSLLAIEVIVNFTPRPFMPVVLAMRAHGLKVEGVGGSRHTGFTIDSVTYADDDFEIELKGLAIGQPESNRGLDADGGPASISSQVTIESMSIRIAKWPTGPVHLPSFESFGIKALDCAKLDIELPGLGERTFERLYASDLVFSHASAKFSAARVFADGDEVLVDAKNFRFDPAVGLFFGTSTQLRLKAALEPEIIHAPIDIDFEGVMTWKGQRNLRLSAFGGRVRYEVKDRLSEVVLTDFTPLHYLKTELPLWNLKLRFQANSIGIAYETLRGEIGLRNHRFKIEPPYLVHHAGKKIYRLKPRLEADWREWLRGEDPGFTFTGGAKKPTRDLLAELYFSRPKAQLGEPELAMIEKDSRFFKSTEKPKSEPWKISGVRLPAAQDAKPNNDGERSEVPQGAVTVLPQFIKKKH